MYADAISFSKFVCSHVFFQYLQCSHFFFKEYWCECTLKRASTLKRGLRVFQHRNSSSPYKVHVYLTETKRQLKKNKSFLLFSWYRSLAIYIIQLYLLKVHAFRWRGVPKARRQSLIHPWWWREKVFFLSFSIFKIN